MIKSKGGSQDSQTVEDKIVKRLKTTGQTVEDKIVKGLKMRYSKVEDEIVKKLKMIYQGLKTGWSKG